MENNLTDGKGVDRQWSQTESISKRLDALAIELKSELKGEIRTFYTKLKDDDIKLGKKLDRTIVWLVTLFLGAVSCAVNNLMGLSTDDA